ncbi:Rieske (2Fe-2S) protein [Streptomyces sp. F8]|uniref:Cytochrome bc1 complex Rieske iron-sulfur subunit n=1 Tax=Streptomyces amritsarensis TaxID=681158 RepID=A0ABX3G640_9ACTN|nr:MULTISPECIES: Rieske (2Fe-2S) protein [Streptomyces]MDX6761293.1 Rieske (2Fe-2S) protein [Streptomyces sp. F8]OLZ68007.1 Rieske (2Fe-2S) protein [Streptomyces amritsarensis]
MSDPTQTARRKVLVIGAATLAGGALTACGSGGDGGNTASAEPNGAASPPPGDAPANPSAGGAPAGKAIAKAADVPVGGGKVLKEQKVVVTQPTAGSFRCFTAVCPHQGCLVTKVENNAINCACHNSEFKATDGAVVKGPATKGLAEKKITVAADGNITLA